MGNFYTNYTLRGPKAQAVAKALAGRSAIVAAQEDDYVVVFDEESDKQDTEVIRKLATKLSRKFKCVVLAVLNHDDDIFWYQLIESGQLVDEYDSNPDYFERKGGPSKPDGGDARKLCAAFGAENIDEIEEILRVSSDDEDAYVFEVDRHQDLVSALDLPSIAVGMGYTDASQSGAADWDENDLIEVK